MHIVVQIVISRRCNKGVSVYDLTMYRMHIKNILIILVVIRYLFLPCSSIVKVTDFCRISICAGSNLMITHCPCKLSCCYIGKILLDFPDNCIVFHLIIRGFFLLRSKIINYITRHCKAVNIRVDDFVSRHKSVQCRICRCPFRLDRNMGVAENTKTDVNIHRTSVRQRCSMLFHYIVSHYH